MTKDNFQMPDYYSTKKPKIKEDLVERKCFRCNKKAKMGKFERYCSPTCRYHATKNYVNGYKLRY